MNCKTGDLAVIVNGKNIGRFCTVLDCGLLANDWWVRLIGGPGPVDRGGRNAMDVEANIDDSRLRPIRDPGDDARDETLSWLDVPSRDKATRDRADQMKKESA